MHFINRNDLLVLKLNVTIALIQKYFTTSLVYRKSQLNYLPSRKILSTLYWSTFYSSEFPTYKEWTHIKC